MHSAELLQQHETSSVNQHDIVLGGFGSVPSQPGHLGRQVVAAAAVR